MAGYSLEMAKSRNTRLDGRVVNEAMVFIMHDTTLAKTASFIGISRSMLHVDLTYKLPLIDRQLFDEVRKLYEKNEQKGHVLAGCAMKKYWNSRKSK